MEHLLLDLHNKVGTFLQGGIDAHLSVLIDSRGSGNRCHGRYHLPTGCLLRKVRHQAQRHSWTKMAGGLGEMPRLVHETHIKTYSK